MVEPQSQGFIEATSGGAQANCKKCGGKVTFRHCEAVCENCGVLVDCSDPFHLP